MRRILLGVLIGSLWGISVESAEPAPTEPSPLSVQIEQKEPGSTIVRLRVLNNTAQKITMNRGDAPWVQRTEIAAAIVARSRDVLPVVYQLESAPPGHFEIPPHGRLAQDVDLQSWFGNLPKALENDDVLVFWSYDFRSVIPAVRSRLFGGLVLRHR